jgi:ribosomal protein L11 methylase PrmA
VQLEPVVAAEPAPKQAPLRGPDVVYVPTPQPVVDRMLELANVSEDDLVYDLGCGDGRILITAAKRHKARGYGVDIDPERVEEARSNVEKSGVQKRVKIELGDAFKVDLRKATVVTLYLLPSLNVKLLPQLRALPPGVPVVSHDFEIAGVRPDKVEELQVEGTTHRIYLFTTPLEG